MQKKEEPCCQDDPTGYVYTGKLDPAPWFVEAYTTHPSTRPQYMVRFRPPGWKKPAALTIASGLNKDTAEHIANARNALDIQLKTGWWAWKNGEAGWQIPNACRGDDGAFSYWCECHLFPSPVTCLIEADKWMKKQEAKHGA